MYDRTMKQKTAPDKSHPIRFIKGGYSFRGATLIHRIDTKIQKTCALCIVLSYYRLITPALTSQNTQPFYRLLTAPSAVHLTSCVLTVLSIPSLCKCTICFYLRFNGFKQCFILNFLYFTSMPSYCQLVFRFIFFCFSHSFTGIYFLTANHFFVRCSIPAARFLVLPAGPVPEPG